MRRLIVAVLSPAVLAVGLVTSLSAAAPASAAAGENSLSAGQSLQAGQDLVSTDGRYEAVMQTDGNFVEYGPSGVVWNSRTGVAGSHIVMQTDGNLVIY